MHSVCLYFAAVEEGGTQGYAIIPTAGVECHGNDTARQKAGKAHTTSQDLIFACRLKGTVSRELKQRRRRRQRERQKGNSID